MSSPRSREFFSRASTRSNVDYTAMIERWQAEYPPGRMLVASNDEVRERPVELLARVFTHLGVSVPDDWSRFPAGSVIDRGVGGGADLVGRQRPDSIPTTTADSSVSSTHPRPPDSTSCSKRVWPPRPLKDRCGAIMPSSAPPECQPAS